jgi:hypothetical protein
VIFESYKELSQTLKSSLLLGAELDSTPDLIPVFLPTIHR